MLFMLTLKALTRSFVPLSVVYLLIFLVFLDYKILQIWSIILPLTFNRVAVVVSKSLNKKSKVITIAIISYKFCPDIMAI